MIEYNKENPLRCFYAFAGYNSQKMELKRLAEHFPEFHHVCVAGERYTQTLSMQTMQTLELF